MPLIFRRAPRAFTMLTVTAALTAGCDLFPPQSGAANPPPAATPEASAAPSVSLPPLEPEPEPVASASASLAPEPVEPGVRQDAGPTRGWLSKAAIKEGIERGNPEFVACYQRRKNAAARGSINVNFVIAPDGSVPHAAALEQGTTLEDDGVIECVLGAFQRLSFSPPSGGRAVVTYPLNFEPAP